MNEETLRSRAVGLAGEPLGEPVRVKGGGNNRLYRFDGVHTFACKWYAPESTDARERFDREVGAMRLLWAFGERRIPELIGCDAEAGIALFRWVDGTPVSGADDRDLDALAAFAIALFAARDRAGASGLAAAREAVLAPADLLDQIDARVRRVAAVGDAELDRLLADLAHERSRLDRPERGTAPLPRACRTLSPSDFGFHNALRTPLGLTFLDFEYFGWDDPVKLVADVLWHPAMALGPAARRTFFRAIAPHFVEADPEFAGRFERDAPLYGLRWAAIVLGEYLPDVWQRRLAAGGDPDRPAVLRRQLAKAADLVARVRAGDLL